MVFASNPAVRAVVVDERGALAELEWAGARVRPAYVKTREVATAAGLFYDAVTEATLVHRGQDRSSANAG